MSISKDALTPGSDNRPRMLYRGNYAQWKERFFTHVEDKDNRKNVKNSILHGPYERKIINVVVDENADPPVAAGIRIQVEEDRSPTEVAKYKGVRQARNVLMQSLSDEIHTTIDSFKIANERWKALERQMQDQK